MRHATLYGWILACSALLTCATLRAEAPRDPAPPPPPTQPAQPADPILVLVAQIGELLQQDTKEGYESAVSQIRTMLKQNQRRGLEARQALRGSWMRALLSGNRYDDILDLTQRAILSAPEETTVEQFLAVRVQALLALGKNTEALSAAKQYFNFAGMKRTSNAIFLVNECLRATHPDDPAILKRFYLEQVQGAQAPATPLSAALAPTAPASVPSTVMAGITFDPAPYESAAKRQGGDDYKGLLTRGNLLLLAGRNKQARETFEFAYSLADSKDLAAASENLARCMKAEDGTIGRANAWIASIRPEYQPARVVQPASLQDVRPDVVPSAQTQARN